MILDENGFEVHNVTLHKGELPEMGATDWWTPEQWDEHNKYVERLKAEGEYLKPVELEVHFKPHPMFEAEKSNEPRLKNFGILIPSGISGEPPKVIYSPTE